MTAITAIGGGGGGVRHRVFVHECAEAARMGTKRQGRGGFAMKICCIFTTN